MVSRRHLLVGCSSVAVSSLAGCLGDSDTNSDESDTDDDSGGNGHSPALADPAEHPEFDGVTQKGIGGPLLTWITDASDSDQALDIFGNPTGEPTQYIDETNFDEYGVLVYTETIQPPCIKIDIPTTTIENGQLYADATYEWPDDCDPGAFAYASYMLRVPVEDPPAEALLDRGYYHSTVSNRYQVEVEEATQSADEFVNRVIEEDELSEPELEELRSAIDEPFERYNPPALVTSDNSWNEAYRVDDTLYIPTVTDVLGSNTREWTTTLRS